MSLVGRKLGGRYRLDSILGTGGMATVYRAQDLRLERPVAVKVLSAELAADASFAKRFDREARALAALSHPAVVSVFDVGEEEGEPWLVMELVEGETLAERIERSGGIDPTEAIPILISVVQGLGALHAAGFVHRDVKPQNVLLSAAGGARLADFGLVRGRGSRALTAPGTTLGTLAYLAPEILAGGPPRPPPTCTA
jgi:serine/threonine protein kinase